MMKLNKDYETQAPENTLRSVEEICCQIREAYLENCHNIGDQMLAELSPKDEGYFISSYILASQASAFALRLRESTQIARTLFEAFPNIPIASQQLVLALCYERRISEAWDLQQWIARKFPDNINNHQNACLLALWSETTEALKYLRFSLMRSDKRYWHKFWYDPELIPIWNHLGKPDVDTEIAQELGHPIWRKFLNSFDAQQPFDLLDPGNLLDFDRAQLNQIVYDERTTFGALLDEYAICAPEAYCKTYTHLNQIRLNSYNRLKIHFNLADSEDWLTPIDEKKACS